VLAFTPHDATHLSSTATLGGALANLALNLRRRDPNPNTNPKPNPKLNPNLALNLRRRDPSGLRGGLRPLISYEVALMLEPLTIAAALVGCVMNKVSVRARAWAGRGLG